MKQTLFLFLIVAALASCKNDPSTQSQEEEPSATPTRPIEPPPGGPTFGKMPSGQTQAVLNFLTTGYWYVEGYVKIGAPEASANSRGRWFQFMPDGTFKSGRYLKTTGAGAWTFDAQTAQILLDAQNAEDGGEWKVQMASSGTVMIWAGTERYGQNSIQQKFENYVELMAELPQPSN
jgi:hypothetical protein